MFGINREQSSRYREIARQYLMRAGVSAQDLGRATYKVKGNILKFTYHIPSADNGMYFKTREVNLDTGESLEKWVRYSKTNLMLYSGRLMCWDTDGMSEC